MKRRKKFKTCSMCGVKPATELPMTGKQLCRWCVIVPGWHLRPKGANVADLLVERG